MTRRGFTLIELLVVIAIIAILAAILFPVFAKAREKARQSSCLSNVKQIGLGIMQYSQDYDERLPSYFNATPNITCPDGTTLAGTTWAMEIYAYVKNAQVFTCPSDTEKVDWSNGALYNYFWNYYGNALSNKAIGSIQYPAELIMVGDGGSYIADPFSANAGAVAAARPQFWSNPAGDYITDGCQGRHNGGANMVFADGHGKWMAFPQAVTDTTPWNPNR